MAVAGELTELVADADWFGEKKRVREKKKVRSRS
jgi:hypothetical protein